MSGPYLGNFLDNATVTFPWDSNDSDGASATRTTDGTVYVQKVGALASSSATAATITKANPGVVTDTAHGLENGDEVFFYNLTEMTEVNQTIQTVANKATDTFEIENTSGHGAAETTGGAWIQVNAADVTDSEDYKGATGSHLVAIDMSADNYFTTGADYFVYLNASTIDTQVVNAVLASFSVENRFNEVDLTHIMGTILTEGGAGRLAAALIKLLDVATPVLTSASVNQTGDNFPTTGYAGGHLWVDTNASNTNTVDYVDGTADNPVSTWGAALTLSASLGIKRFRIINGSSITLSANSDNYTLCGDAWTLALGGQSFSGGHVTGPEVSGVCTGATAPEFDHCHFINATVPPSRMKDCGFGGTLTMGSAGAFYFDGCYSMIAGTSTPILDFGSGLNASQANFRHYSGGLDIRYMGAGTGTYRMSLEGDGQLIINANCSATSTIVIRGHFTVTNNASGITIVYEDSYARLGAPAGASVSADIADVRTELGKIANVGASVNAGAESYTLTTGTQASGTYTSTLALDDTYHQHTDDGGTLELYYQFDVGGDGVANSVTFTGRINGSNDDMDIWAYNWGTPGWDQIGVFAGKNQSSDDVNTYTLFTSHTGTGANLGKVRIRFYQTGLTTANLYVDQVYLSYSVVHRTVGYAGGAIWVDTNASNTNTESFVDGTADNPVSTWAAALTLSTNLNLNRFQIANGSAITLSGNSDNYFIEGQGYTLALGGQSVDALFCFGGSVSGTGTATNHPVFEDCPIGNVTLPPSIMRRCFLSGTITNSGTGDWFINHCMSRVAGSAAPVFDFGTAVGNTNLHMRLYSGGIQLESMGDTGTDVASIEGQGQIIEGTCAGGAVTVRGLFTISGITNITLSDDGRLDTEQVFKEALKAHYQVSGELYFFASTGADGNDGLRPSTAKKQPGVLCGSLNKGDAMLVLDNIDIIGNNLDMVRGTHLYGLGTDESVLYSNDIDWELANDAGGVPMVMPHTGCRFKNLTIRADRQDSYHVVPFGSKVQGALTDVQLENVNLFGQRYGFFLQENAAYDGEITFISCRLRGAIPMYLRASRWRVHTRNCEFMMKHAMGGYIAGWGWRGALVSFGGVWDDRDSTIIGRFQNMTGLGDYRENTDMPIGVLVDEDSSHNSGTPRVFLDGTEINVINDGTANARSIDNSFVNVVTSDVAVVVVSGVDYDTSIENGAIVNVPADNVWAVTARALTDKDGFGLAADGLDTLPTTEPTSGADAKSSVLKQLLWLVRRMMAGEMTDTTIVVRKADGTTISTQAISDVSGTQTVGEPV